ncbi:MAG: hypothetical protein IH866_05755 [Chloroflexi bacterium]|nr:hypothetical protein [Chloroflexota bacterium]
MLLVAAASVVAFVALAFPIYSLYTAFGDAVYDWRFGGGLVVVQILFYTAFVLHVLGSLGVAVVLTRWMRAPFRYSIAVVFLMIALLAGPTLGTLTGVNQEHYDKEFPFPGQGYR